jgi:stage II sporulation protein AA (anti-sigma F factor antagonist)
VEQARLEVEHESVTGGAVLTVAGEIDADTAGILTSALAEAGASGPPAVVVDFTAVTFMDSSGINTLLHAHHDLAARGARLAVAGVPASVLRILGLTGVDQVIPVYATVTEALHP